MQGDKAKSVGADTRPRSQSNFLSALRLGFILGAIGLFIVPWIGIAAALVFGKDSAFTAVVWAYATISIALVLWVGSRSR